MKPINVSGKLNGKTMRGVVFDPDKQQAVLLAELRRLRAVVRAAERLDREEFRGLPMGRGCHCSVCDFKRAIRKGAKPCRRK